MDWLKNEAKGQELSFSSPERPADARTLFRQQAADWEPDTAGDTPRFIDSELCRVRAKSASDTGPLTLRFGASVAPFDTDFAKPVGDGIKRTAFEAGPDVKLVYWQERTDGSMQYYAYIKCGVPGAAANRATEVPLRGHMTDGLTENDSHRAHLQHLLHSTKVAAEEFGCTNKPDIPTTAPTSVKD
ncbi:hypothetical protein [Streptomyces mesophilus]|uniref:hypothetical protein n=1 Tax=Streptomyces mesophilus TaxID=1775132 RepID=UPI00333121B0